MAEDVAEKLYVLTFPVEYINTTDYLQLIMTFTGSGTGTVNVTTEAMKIIKWGNIEYSYDLEDALLVPSFTDLVIQEDAGDGATMFNNLFFGSAYTTVSKEPVVEIKLNGNLIFKGSVIEDTIRFNPNTGVLKFRASPKTDILNKQMLYDLDGNPTNPFNYDEGTIHSIRSVLSDMFALVSNQAQYPSGLSLIHNWVFKGRGDAGPGEGFDYLSDIEFREMYVWIDAIFFELDHGLRTVGDALKKLAQDYGAFTGMVTTDHAFFKKLFHFDESNTQSINIIKQEKGYRYGLLDYVKVNTSWFGVPDPNSPYEAGQFTELEDRYLERDSFNYCYWDGSATIGSNMTALVQRSNYTDTWYEFDHNGNISNFPKYGDRYKVDGTNLELEVAGETFFSPEAPRWIVFKRITDFLPPASGTLIRISGSGNPSITYNGYRSSRSSNSRPNGSWIIYRVKDPQLDNGAWKEFGQLLADFWFNFRGNLQNCRVDRFTAVGVDYDFLKDFTHNQENFQPIKMIRKLASNITEVEAIYIGES